MFIRTAIDRSVAILLHPHLFFSRDDDFMDFGDGSIYTAMMGFLAALVAVTMGSANSLFNSNGLVPILIFSPLIAILGTFIMGGIIHALCRSLGSRNNYGDSFHIAASASVLMPISQLLDAFSLSILSLAWAWWIVSRGAICVHHLEPRQAAVVFALLYASFFILSAASN